MRSLKEKRIIFFATGKETNTIKWKQNFLCATEEYQNLKV